jgi:tRNA dimethylallyltransferase
MIKNGLIDEVKKLYDLGYRPETHQSMKGIGYKEIVDYFEGVATLDVAVEKLKQHTRNYAKRQITWFKRNKDIHWFDIEKDSDIINQIIELYNK